MSAANQVSVSQAALLLRHSFHVTCRQHPTLGIASRHRLASGRASAEASPGRAKAILQRCRYSKEPGLCRAPKTMPIQCCAGTSCDASRADAVVCRAPA